MKLPSLTAVRHFEAAARLVSFSAAAAELHVTQGAVSRMIQTLEEQLGVRLFERNGRWISLTPLGKRYHRQITAGLTQIAEASSRLSDSAGRSTVTLSVNVGFGTLWLAHNMGDFHAKHPGIQLNVLAAEHREYGHVAGVQASIRYGSPPWRGYDSTRLLPSAKMAVVCSPRLEQLAKIRKPADLLAGPLLRISVEEDDPWRDYFEHHGLEMADLGKSPRFLQLLMMREAAISGLGFAVVPLFLFEQDLRDGRLVQALPHTCETRHGYHFLVRKGEDLDPQVKTFEKWLVARLRATVTVPPAR